MAAETFVDTSGLYALLVRRDGMHERARQLMEEARKKRRRFVTTDYVLDEAATLLTARGHGRLLDALFEATLESKACRVEWTSSERFTFVTRFIMKHRDKKWSFTDCLSFTVMRDLRLRDALTKDVHFEQAGFRAILR